MPKFETILKLAGMGAFGAIGGLSLAFGLFVALTAPSRTGGIDATGAAVTWIAVGGVLLALVVLHIVLGKQILRLSRGLDKKHPL
jgi:hypothetical protein